MRSREAAASAADQSISEPSVHRSAPTLLALEDGVASEAAARGRRGRHATVDRSSLGYSTRKRPSCPMTRGRRVRAAYSSFEDAIHTGTALWASTSQAGIGGDALSSSAPTALRQARSARSGEKSVTKRDAPSSMANRPAVAAGLPCRRTNGKLASAQACWTSAMPPSAKLQARRVVSGSTGSDANVTTRGTASERATSCA